MYSAKKAVWLIKLDILKSKYLTVLERKTLLQFSYDDLLDHFSKSDLKLFSILEKVGPFEFNLTPNPFQALVESILSQQVSSKSADSTIKKVEEFMDGFDQPENWIGIERETWREYGVSRQKASYLNNIAEYFTENKKEVDSFSTMEDSEILESLVKIKGVGEWTAQMFLIFCLGRPNVLAPGDLGIQVMSQKLYGLKEAPDKKKLLEISKNWEPHISWAQLYLWKASRLGSLD